MRKKLNSKFRKAADGGNIALVALAVGVIIIIGMYVFTSKLGSQADATGQNITANLETITQSDLAVVGK